MRVFCSSLSLLCVSEARFHSVLGRAVLLGTPGHAVGGHAWTLAGGQRWEGLCLPAVAGVLPRA